MTVEKELVSEIEAAVDQSIEDAKGFQEVEEKQAETETPKEEVLVETAVFSDDPNATESDHEDKFNEDNESGRKESEAVTEEASGTESGATADSDGKGKEREPEGLKATPESLEVPVIGEGALELAIRSGFTVAEANSFGNEQTLLKAVQIINEKTPVGVAEKEHVEKELLLSDLPKLDPEQYEPEVIASFKKIKDAYQKQQETIEQLVQETQASQANQHAQAGRELVAWFDGKVAGLGKQHIKTLGEGSHDSLNQGSSQYAKREEIADHINLLSAGYAGIDRESPPLDVLFDQAAKFVLQDEIGEIKEKKLSDRLSKRAGQHLARPSSEKVGTLETAEAAEKELAGQIDKQFFKDR